MRYQCGVLRDEHRNFEYGSIQDKEKFSVNQSVIVLVVLALILSLPIFGLFII